MLEWKKISEGCTFLSGFAFKGSDFNEEFDGFPIIKIKNIQNDFVTLESSQFISIKKLNNYKSTEKFKVASNEILVAMTGAGSVGRVGLTNYNGVALLNQRVGKFEVDEINLNKEFLFNVLTSKYFKKLLFNKGQGSGQPNLSPNDILEVKIPFPTYREQKEIGKTMQLLIKKILLLQAQNKTLEETAQTIFKEWFGKYSVDDELPDGYKFGVLGDVALNHSKTFKFTNENIVFINTGDVLEGQFLHANEISPEGLPGQAKKAIELHDILYSEIRPKNKRFAFIDFDTSNYVVSTKFMIIRPKNDFSPFILYLILKNQETIDEFNIVAESRSGTFPQITFDSVKSFPILIPSKQKQNEFDDLLISIMEKKKNNHQQIQTLTKTRDELLPRLMSGEVRVKH